MSIKTDEYPVTYSCEEPDTLSRWLWIVKLALVMPHLAILLAIWVVSLSATAATWLVIVVTGRRPKMLFDFIVGVTKYNCRVSVCVGHMTDQYPPILKSKATNYPVFLTADYSEEASRVSSFFRIFLVFPHLILLGSLGVFRWWLGLFLVVYVIFTGRPHSSIFRLSVALDRWAVRVDLYNALATDRYPPFTFD